MELKEMSVEEMETVDGGIGVLACFAIGLVAGAVATGGVYAICRAVCK